jgi:acetoin utilization protein AcuB
MTAEQIMTHDPIAIDQNTSLGEALIILVENNIRHLPVVHDGEIVGMLSDRDLRSLGLSTVSDMESLEKYETLLQASVLSLMNSDVITVDRAAGAREIVELMLAEKVGAVPVVDSDTNNLIGIVSYIDILHVLEDHLDEVRAA